MHSVPATNLEEKMPQQYAGLDDLNYEAESLYKTLFFVIIPFNSLFNDGCDGTFRNFPSSARWKLSGNGNLRQKIIFTKFET